MLIVCGCTKFARSTELPSSASTPYVIKYSGVGTSLKDPSKKSIKCEFVIAESNGKWLLKREFDGGSEVLLYNGAQSLQSSGSGIRILKSGLDISALSSPLLLPLNTFDEKLFKTASSGSGNIQVAFVYAKSEPVYLPSSYTGHRIGGAEPWELQYGLSNLQRAKFTYLSEKSFPCGSLPTKIMATYNGFSYDSGKQLAFPNEQWEFTLLSCQTTSVDESLFKAESYLPVGSVVSCWIGEAEFGVMYDPKEGTFDEQVARAKEMWKQRGIEEKKAQSPFSVVLGIVSAFLAIVAILLFFRRRDVS